MLVLLYKPIYWLYRLAGAIWYWARRRFTRAGQCVVISFFIAGAVGTNIDSTVSYQAFALLSAYLALALCSSFFFKAKFSVDRVLPRFGTVGVPLHYQVSVKNLTGRLQSDLVLLEDLRDPRPSFNDWFAYQMNESRRSRAFRILQKRRKSPFHLARSKSAPVVPVPANGTVNAAMEIVPLRRGILRYDGMTLGRPDALGLYLSFIKFPAPQQILILPKRYPLPAFNLPGAMRYQPGGVALASNIGRSEEFAALREYRYGDPLRHIHWRSWAKTGKPVVKEFEDEFFVRHALVLDTFSSEPDGETFEEAISVAASFACTLINQESLLDLLFVGDKSYCFTAGRGLAHADQMLEILASAKNCTDKPFESLERLVLNHISAVSGCICVLQNWDEARRKLINKLKVMGIPLLVLIVMPPGEGISGAGGPLQDSSGSLQVLEVGKIEEGLAKLS